MLYIDGLENQTKGFIMKNYQLPLPKRLHSKDGHQPEVQFSMSHRHYEINGEQFHNPLHQEFNAEFKGYMAAVMNKFIVVTLFFEDDVIQTI